MKLLVIAKFFHLKSLTKNNFSLPFQKIQPSLHSDTTFISKFMHTESKSNENSPHYTDAVGPKGINFSNVL